VAEVFWVKDGTPGEQPASAPARVDIDRRIDLPYPRDPVRTHEDARFIAGRTELYLSITGRR